MHVKKVSDLIAQTVFHARKSREWLHVRTCDRWWVLSSTFMVEVTVRGHLCVSTSSMRRRIGLACICYSLLYQCVDFVP